MITNITDYTKILPIGKESAISSADLTVLMGFECVRALQTDIAKARNAGQIILSSTSGGYYLPKDDTEVQEFVDVLMARAINTFRAITSARAYLKKDKAQMTINEIEILEDEI